MNVSHTVGALDRKHIAMKKPKKIRQLLLELQGLLFPGPARHRIPIPVHGLWVKWFFLRCTDFQQKQFEED